MLNRAQVPRMDFPMKQLLAICGLLSACTAGTSNLAEDPPMFLDEDDGGSFVWDDDRPIRDRPLRDLDDAGAPLAEADAAPAEGDAAPDGPIQPPPEAWEGWSEPTPAPMAALAHCYKGGAAAPLEAGGGSLSSANSVLCYRNWGFALHT